MAWRLVLWAGLFLSLCMGCSSANDPDRSPRRVVTADWLNKRLSVFDYEALIAGELVDGDMASVIDLSAWDPGPLELEITPDGLKAVVAVGPGFFDGDGITNELIGSPVVPPGGALLIVDLSSGDVVEVQINDVPMGIAISADGTTAYTANYGTVEAPGDTMSIVDLGEGTVVEEVMFDGRPEQVALSPSGELGVINVAGTNGGIHVFETEDPAGTLSPLVTVGTDPSDVTFLSDDTRVVVANSFSFDVALVDTSNPAAPSTIANFPISGGVPYGVTYMPGRNQVLAPTGTPANLVTIDIEGDTLIPSEPAPLLAGAFPLTTAVDPDERYAFTAHIEDKSMSIVELDTGETNVILWLDEPGPAYVAVTP